MKLTLHTLAYDTANAGTGCEIFLTDREARLRQIEMVTTSKFGTVDEEEKKELTELLDLNDGMDAYQDAVDELKDGLDTFEVEEHKIEIPAVTEAIAALKHAEDLLLHNLTAGTDDLTRLRTALVAVNAISQL